jgi:hypothetical protein
MRRLTLALRAYAAAELDGPGSKTTRSLAEEVGCSNFTVSVAVQALKIAYVSIANTSDLEAADAYDATMREMRAPKRALPPGMSNFSAALPSVLEHAEIKIQRASEMLLDGDEYSEVQEVLTDALYAIEAAKARAEEL